MTVRLSHRQKPDTQNYIFQALGSPFSLTGIAASLRIAYRMSIPDKIPYVLSGQPATVSKLPPVWGLLGSYSITATTPVSAQALPVSVPGGGSPTITVAWHSSSVPSTKPSWVTLTSGTAPTIAFTGDANQIDSADVSSMVLSATANGGSPVLSASGSITVSASSGLSLSYGPNEGYTSTDGTLGGPRPRLVRGQMYYESAYVTKDGTLIEHADGAHGTVRWTGDLNQSVLGSGNRVGEWNPATGRLIEVYPENKEDHGAQSYDNTIYCYFDSIDSLVQFKSGAFYRPLSKFLPDGSSNPSGDTMVTRTWTGPSDFNHTTDPSADYWSPSKGSTSDTGTSAWNYQQNPGTAERFPRSTQNSAPPPSGRPLLFSSNASLSPAPLMYVPAARLAAYNQHVSYYNAPVCYSRQFDVALIIGGAPGSSDPYGGFTNAYVSAIIPMNRTSVGATARYYVNCTSYSWTATQVGTGYWLTGDGGRSGAKFLNNYVYWVGGRWNGAGTPWLWRANILPVLENPTADLSTTFIVEQMASLPGSTMRPLLTADPYSNTLLCISNLGIHLYDAATNSWSTRTSEFTDYAQYWSPGSFPDWMHGDFVDYVTSNGARPRKTYFYGGWDGSSLGGTYNERLEKVRSIKVTRTGTVSYLSVEAENPENSAQTFGSGGVGPLRSIKHLTLQVAGDYLYLAGGDWDDHYPVNVSGGGTSGYKIETAGVGGIGDPNSQNGRQEIWRTQISTSVASGTARWRMIGNAYAEYPWRNDLSHGFYDGAVRGPFMPDGIGSFTDSSGQLWIGPADVGYSDLVNSEMAGQINTYAPMFKFTPPGTNSTATTGAGINGVALGNGWTLPTQDRIAYCLGSGSSAVGTAGVDYDIGFVTGSCIGWGRPNKGPAYDSSDNKARVVSVNGSGSAPNFTFDVSVYAFNCTAVAGRHSWTKQTLTGVPIQKMGAPGGAIVTSVNTGWGTGGVGNTCQIGRTLYFSLMVAYGVNDGSGNYVSGTRYSGQIITVNLDSFPAAGSVSWLPLPEKMNWWLRTWDGPDAASAQARSLFGPTGTLITPGQYRSMVAVGTKLVLGPDRWNKINVDPWIAVYDTVTKTWTMFQSAGSNDWPNSLMSLVAVPSLGEAWLCGQATASDYGSGDPSYLAYLAANGMHSPTTVGSDTGRRIVRFKVN